MTHGELTRGHSMKRIIAITAVAVSLAAGSFTGSTGGRAVRRGGRERGRGDRLHLPDAPGLPQRPSRRLRDLRHAPRAGSPGQPSGGRRGGAHAPARRGAGEPRTAAGGRHPAWRRQPDGQNAAAADNRAGGARREPDLSDCRRRERLDSQGGDRRDGRLREGAPGTRVVRGTTTRVR